MQDNVITISLVTELSLILNANKSHRREYRLVALGCTFINTNYPFHIIQLSVVFFQKRGC
jgi:hypothetical protein